jgi:hypothetical protein
MHWEILIVPLIALGVWILGTLFRSEDEKIKKGPRRPGSSAPRTSGRRPVTNLEQFLEEARRRREAEERAKAPPPPPPPARSPLRERPSRPAQKPAVRRAEVPVAVPVARLVAPTEAIDVVEVVSASPPPAPTTTREPQLSPMVQQVRSLLSKPQTAATAFMLREIFDRPLCQRRRR